VELVFTAADVPAFEQEPFSPPDIALKWQVRHYYGGPETAAAFWAQRSEGFAENLKFFTSQNERLRRVLDGLPETPAAGGVQAAYGWLNENIININLDEVTGEVEGNGCVDDVITHGYGNSLEISSVFYDMLRQMTIGAKIAFAVNRNDNVFISDARYWQFDRTLVAIPDGTGGYTFYKPGYDYLAPGQVDWYSEGTTALIVGDRDRRFTTVPLSAAGINRTSRDLTLSMSENLRLEGTMTEYCEGQPARSHRVPLRNSSEAEVVQYLRDHLAEILPRLGASAPSVDHLEDNRQPLVISCSVEGDYSGQQMGSKLLFRPYHFLGKQESPFTQEGRAYSLVFEYAHETVENLNLDLPPGWRADATPNDTTFSNQVGECGISFVASDEGLTIRRVFVLSSPLWEASVYEDVRSLFQARQAFSEIAVVLSRD
jgi:hypothetical protein